MYSYRGGNQRKIILTVEQNRDQPYRMVLWGAGAAWCPQLQRKKGKVLVSVGRCKRIFVMLLVPFKCSAGNIYQFNFYILPLVGGSIFYANSNMPPLFRSSAISSRI